MHCRLKGDGHLLCKAPFGPLPVNGADPFFNRRPEAKPTGKDFSRVKPHGIALRAPRSSAVRCLVAGHGACRVPLRQIPTLMSTPLILKSEPLPASFFKHADEQTVAGFAALAQAIQVHDLAGVDFSEWGVVAAPRFLVPLPVWGRFGACAVVAPESPVRRPPASTPPRKRRPAGGTPRRPARPERPLPPLALLHRL